jgi:flagellar biosynthesis protein FlhA
MAPDELLAEQLKSTTLANASQILTRDATRQLIDEIQKTSPAVVDELIPELMTLGQVQQVLKSLLDEGVSIRPLGLILETLGDNASLVNNRWDLVERVRLRLSRHITSSLRNASTNAISVFTISQELQDRIACSWERNLDEIRIGMPREIVESLVLSMENAAAKMWAAGLQPVVLVDQVIRPVIAELAFEIEPPLFVIGSREVNGAEMQVVGEVTADQINSAVDTAA